PVVLTAAAASLGMIPIASEVFWGLMAYAIIGGLSVATLLRLLFLPALYVAWFRIKEPEPGLGAREPAAGKSEHNSGVASHRCRSGIVWCWDPGGHRWTPALRS
ncbi:MAG TPA: hypothetical protein VIX37_00165, partial [Candidatus Sulfotelmatobacter sp.]